LTSAWCGSALPRRTRRCGRRWNGCESCDVLTRAYTEDEK
jgi:hypothetical protein